MAREPTTDPEVPLSPDDLAYLIYTSGSTGRPKGAGNTHRGLTNRLLWMQEHFGLQTDERVLHKTPLGFDVSVWELFWPLVAGASLVLARPGDQRDGERLLALIARHDVSTLHFVPSMLAAFLETPGLAQGARPLRRVVCSGEALPAELADRFFAQLGAELHNLYGPTEAAIDVSAWACRPEPGAGSVPIGRPIANAQLYVLDPLGHPLPPGLAGELFIGGVPLARGYHRRPALTAERFVPDPFGPPGARLYKTGDRARFRPDGAIEFLGRLDFQVKLRGQRIELGEIEAALRQQPAVRDAAALVHQGPHGGKRLVAYVTGRAGEPPPEPEALRAALARALPAAMLPWPIRVLDAMPLSPNGKLDRRALPAPDAPAAARPYVPPRTEAEHVLAAIWAEVLCREQVGIEDDFFELGGDSIMTLQIIARAARRGLRLTPKLLFEHPTIAAAAARAEATTAPEPAAAPPPAKDPGAELSPEEWSDLLEEIGRLPVSTNNGPDASSNVESVYPLSPMQEGMLFYTLLRPRSGIYLMQNRYRLEGDLRPDAFVRGWQLVAERHPVFRTSFAWKSQKRPLQVVHRRVELPFEVLDWRDLGEAAQDARLDLLLRRELEEGFDFGKAPLTRFRLIRLGERTYEFVHSFHHILFDEWCTSLIMVDFLSYYEAMLRGEPPSLPPARPYRDYIDWLGRQDLPAAEAFWRAELRGFSNPTPLGLDGGRPPDAAGGERVEDLVSRLPPGATAALGALAQRHRLTLNTLVQGAWALLLRRYSGELEVLFGVTVAGRPPELPGVESIVGLFINTLPLRVPVPDEEPLVPWLKALQNRNLLLRQHGHAPLASVQGWSEVERGRPLFQSLFVFENAPIDPSLREGRIAFRVQQVRDRVHTNYPITIMSWAEPELPLKISYDRAALSPDTAARLLGHLGTLLEGMAARPDARLGELPMLTPSERHRALFEWNHAPAVEPDFSSYAALFDAQAARTPDAVAATCRDRRLTYAELSRDAGRLARALVARCVGPERRVALLDERGLELLTMMVAVFKAGGAYVPLSTDDPSERAARAVASSEASVLLTREAFRKQAETILRAVAPSRPPALVTFEEVMGEGHAEGLLPDQADRAEGPLPDRANRTEGLLPDRAGRAEGPLPDRGGPGHLAYVIYTSGSTGVPKGAMVERRGMLNNMLSKVPRLSLEPGDVIAQTASPCFDISVWQFLTAPLFGGVVEIVPDEITRDPGRLLDHVERRGVAVLEVVPAVLKGMLEAASERAVPPALARLRWVLPTGEALPAALAREWLIRYPHVPLMNAYGPAECSDDVALHPLTEPPDEGASQVPIGRPVDHLRLYVLDPLLEPAPAGVSGELYVGGIGV
ncbi:MAG TPA: amino acid adenylation domain-containing protein, partial [Polyangiaceae bacterium]|nr:amino acid adenylation domain-containing protein [Polyangiaceae bacterium]